MKLIDQSFEIISYPSNVCQKIEKAARTCYKSEDKICPGSAEKMVKMLIKSGHEAMIEFGGVATVRFKVDRAVSHELVRHRLASFAQESQRYVNYNKKEIEFIITNEIRGLLMLERDNIEDVLRLAEKVYIEMVEFGTRPEIARCVLPNATATEINIQANIREWRHILKLRTSKAAYPPMRRLMRQLLEHFKKIMPVVFDDILPEKKVDKSLKK